ncbi:MAG: hypothetical protein ACTSXO_07060 [Candidatus Heimdallarchaeota archaeon]
MTQNFTQDSQPIATNFFKKKITLQNQYFDTKAQLNLRIANSKVMAANFDGELDVLKLLEPQLTNRSWTENLQFLDNQLRGPYRKHISMNHILLLEKLAKITAHVPKRAIYLRTMRLEFERIEQHLLFLSEIALKLSFPLLQLRLLDFKEKTARLKRQLFPPSNKPFNVIGGVGFNLSQQMISFAKEQLIRLQKKSLFISRLFNRNWVIKNRLKDVGFLTRADAKKYGLVGPLARSTGITDDIRVSDPYLAYPEIDFSLPVSDFCDLYGEVLVRIDEIQESFKILRELLRNLPAGAIKLIEVPEELSIGTISNRLETPSGELFSFIVNKNKEILSAPNVYQFTSPLKINQQGILLRLSGEVLENINLLVATISEGWSD